jgi:hypothetical protein
VAAAAAGHCLRGIPPRFSGSDDGLPLADDKLEISAKAGRAGGTSIADGMVEGSTSTAVCLSRSRRVRR